MPPQFFPAGQSPQRPAADCRVYERIVCELPATCQPASALEMKEMRWGGTITDISQGGVRIVLQRRFEKGTGLAMELPGERESNVVFVKVMHVRRLDDGTYTLGCKFISELSDDEMRRLLSSTNRVLSSAKEHANDEHAPPDQEDDEPAMPANRDLTDVHLLVESSPGSIVECRIKRLNVTNCWPLTPGKILSLRGKTGGQSPWSARIQVIEFTPRAKGCEIRGRSIEQS